MARTTKLITRACCLAAPMAVLGLTTPVFADSAPCRLNPVSQEFEWSRQFQGVPQPITWKISRQVEFEATGQDDMFQVHETLEMELPEFRSKFGRFVGSAKLDSCEQRFSVKSRTPTAHGNAIRVPFVVMYEVATCKNYRRICRSNGNVFRNCERHKRKITRSDAAEIDVNFVIELQKPNLESVVTWEQSPHYSQLNTPEARSLFEQVLDDASEALAFITGGLGTISIASFDQEPEAYQVNGGFTLFDASTYHADASYRLNHTQACAVHAQLLDQKPEATGPVSPREGEAATASAGPL